MQNSVQITIDVDPGESRDQLIAQLSVLEIDGFEETGHHLICYFTQDRIDRKHLDEILKQRGLKYSFTVVNPKNWNKEWESSFSPVVINDFCVIRADFHSPVPAITYDIIITPKMSFGTGHHATTYLMIQEMAKLDFRGKSVVDFGTGTGVLAILAEKLGSTEILAIDNDDWSIENAKENITRNACKSITIEKADVYKSNKKFDIILANINKNVILQNLGGLVFGLKKGGQILLSGLLRGDEEDILLSARRHNLSHRITVEREKWISMLLTY